MTAWPRGPRRVTNLGNLALHLGDDAAHRAFFGAMLTGARADGAVMEVLYALHRLCFSQYAGGDWAGVLAGTDDEDIERGGAPAGDAAPDEASAGRLVRCARRGGGRCRVGVASGGRHRISSRVGTGG
jgi:hypothetical protein